MNDLLASRVLLAILRERWSEAEGLVAAAPLDPTSFARFCVACEVHPWVHALLERERRWPLVGDTARDALARARNKVRHDNLLLLARLEQGLDVLRRAGIEPVVLKGTDTLHRFYRGFDERALHDVDLLLAGDELRPALAALEAAGWTGPGGAERLRWVRGSHHLPLDSPGPLPVPFEIHWNLAQESRFAVDVAGLLARAVPLDVAGRPARRLADHDAAAHLLLHHFSHYFAPGLKNLIDLRFLAAQPGFRWARVVELARSWRAATACGSALAHIRDMWPELVPAEIARELPLAAWRRVLAAPLRSRDPLQPFRGSRTRRGQHVLAAILIERPAALPGWLLHRATRGRRAGRHPLDPG